VHFDDSLAYLSCSFGIVVVDMSALEIRDTYRPEATDIEIHATATAGGEIFASTAQGLYRASLTDGSNLLDFGSWTKQVDSVNFHDTDIDTGLVIPFDGTVVANSHDTLMKYDGQAWNFFYSGGGWQPISLSVTGSQLIVVEHDTSGSQAPHAARITVVNADGSATSYLQGMTAVPLSAVLTDDGNLWVADLHQGLKRYHIASGTVESIVPNGPFSNDVFAMDVREGKLWVVAGAIDGTLNLQYNQSGFFSYDGWWTNYNSGTLPELSGTFDWIAVKVDPNNTDRVYFASHWAGLGILDGGTFTIYDQSNSPLQGAGNVTHVGAFAVDGAGNLWMTNDGAAEPLVVLKPDGDWLSFPVPSNSKDIFDMVIDDYDQVWTLTSRSPAEGPVVYDPGPSLESPSDDRATVLSSQIGDGALPTNVDISIANDHDGEIWVGTSAGVGVFYCPGEVLDAGCDADKIIVERDGFLGYLLEMEIVQAIEIDGANRKWVGTENGVFLLSADGTEELLHFTESNSPLFSNTITDIAIDHSTGVVWIGTDMGLNSYQGDAIEGSATHDCFIYPNPVREDYTGPIVIKGLVSESDVRITDVAGNLVYHAESNGGMATWDGNMLNGARAHSGVYYVFSSNADGSDKTACKLVLIR
jgi:ligand-binding sensor domain-containing protein